MRLRRTAPVRCGARAQGASLGGAVGRIPTATAVAVGTQRRVPGAEWARLQAVHGAAINELPPELGTVIGDALPEPVTPVEARLELPSFMAMLPASEAEVALRHERPEVWPRERDERQGEFLLDRACRSASLDISSKRRSMARIRSSSLALKESKASAFDWKISNSSTFDWRASSTLQFASRLCWNCSMCDRFCPCALIMSSRWASWSAVAESLPPEDCPVLFLLLLPPPELPDPGLAVLFVLWPGTGLIAQWSLTSVAASAARRPFVRVQALSTILFTEPRSVSQLVPNEPRGDRAVPVETQLPPGRCSLGTQFWPLRMLRSEPRAVASWALPISALATPMPAALPPLALDASLSFRPR